MEIGGDSDIGVCGDVVTEIDGAGNNMGLRGDVVAVDITASNTRCSCVSAKLLSTILLSGTTSPVRSNAFNTPRRYFVF